MPRLARLALALLYMLAGIAFIVVAIRAWLAAH
ncbi:hypothetical protein MMA231_00893 [Asticcacaulis sp. MM231]